MRLLLLLSQLLLISCSNFQYTATAPNGGTETVAYFTFGGSSAMETAGGTRLTQNHNKSFGQANQTAATAIGVWGAAYTRNSDNALSATQSTNATTQSINATNTAAKAATASEAIKAGAAVAPIKITPP